MATMTNSLPQPIGVGVGSGNGANRGIIGQLLNPEAIAEEDFIRDLQKMEYTNKFNANEAEKNRQWQERLSNTAYQRAVADMKKAGINPIIGLGMANSASSPSGGYASGSTSSSKGFTASDSGILQLVGSIANMVAGVYTSGASNATKLKVAKTIRIKK